MKIKELIKKDIDIDVYDNVTQEIVAISFAGPVGLTEEGRKYFKETLEYEVKLYEEEGWASVKCNDQEPEIKWLTKAKKAQKFFFACAGYCSVEDYDKWFKTDKKITKEMINDLNAVLKDMHCAFKFKFNESDALSTIPTIEVVPANSIFIDSSIINLNSSGHAFIRGFFNKRGIELMYNNTGTIMWAKN